MSDPFQNPATFNPATFNPAEFNPATAGPLWPGHPAYPGRRPDEEWAASQASLPADGQAGTPIASQAHTVPAEPPRTPARLDVLQQLVHDEVISQHEASGLINAEGRVGDAEWAVIRERMGGERPVPRPEGPQPAAQTPTRSTPPAPLPPTPGLSAEEALRARRRQEAVVTQRDQQRSAHSMAERRADLVAQVEALVPQALAGLRRAAWPGGQLLKVRGKLRRKEVAAWTVGGYRFRGKPDGSSGRVNALYLLSDGRWMYGHDGEPQSFAAIVSRFAGAASSPGSLMVSELPAGVVEGLRELAAL